MKSKSTLTNPIKIKEKLNIPQYKQIALYIIKETSKRTYIVNHRRQRLGPKFPWHTKPTLDTQWPSSTSVLRLSRALVRQLNSQSEWSDSPTDRQAPTPIQHVESSEKKLTRTNFSRRRGTHWENLVSRRTKTARWPTVGLVCTGLNTLRLRLPRNQPVSARSSPIWPKFTFTFSHLADAFIQSDLQLGRFGFPTWISRMANTGRFSNGRLHPP